MTWQVLCAASAQAVADDDLIIEARELARANAEVLPHVCHSETEVTEAGASADGLLTVGVGLDVFEEEPPDPSNPLLALATVVCTPHAAGTSTASIPNDRRLAAAALALAVDGLWSPHVVNPEVRGRTRFPFVDSQQVYATHP